MSHAAVVTRRASFTDNRMIFVSYQPSTVSKRPSALGRGTLLLLERALLVPEGALGFHQCAVPCTEPGSVQKCAAVFTG